MKTKVLSFIEALASGGAKLIDNNPGLCLFGCFFIAMLADSI